MPHVLIALGPIALGLFACAQDRAAPPVASSVAPVAAPAPAVREPAFEPETLAAAMALGDCERALALLPGAPGPAERLAAAHCELDLGRPADALTRLDAVDGPLADYAGWYRARALQALDRPVDEVLAALADVELPGDSGLRIRLLRAKLAEDLPALRALSDTSVGLEAAYEAAMLTSGAARREALQALWARAVAPWDDLALRALEGPPSLGDPGGRALARQRLRALQRANRHTEALALLEQLVEADDADRPSALELARARFAAKVYDRAIESWRAALGEPAAAAGRPADLFDYALSFARLGDYDTAAVVYRRLMAQHPTTSQADLASFKLGYMAYDEGACDEAVPLLREHVAARSGSRHLDEALWFEARCHWRADDLDAAGEAWRRLLSARPDSSLVPGAAYWLARVDGRRGDAIAERRGLERVLERHPDSGYAWFAAEALDRSWPAAPSASPPPFPAALATDPHVVRAGALTGVGLRTLARAELAEVRASGRDASLALAWARIGVGDYRGGQQLARPYCGAPWDGGDPVAQQACWPRPERELVDAVVARHGLPELLPYAIMSAESALDPAVTSPAGARGLMQLMPEVGAGLHEEVFTGRYDPARLYSPPYNAILGTWELGRRARSLDGALAGSDLPAVIASYNAGEEAVRRWLDAAGAPPPPDAFAEDVGYTETRQYVKRVLGYLMTWRHVYGDDAPAQ